MNDENFVEKAFKEVAASTMRKSFFVFNGASDAQRQVRARATNLASLIASRWAENVAAGGTATGALKSRDLSWKASLVAPVFLNTLLGIEVFLGS